MSPTKLSAPPPTDYLLFGLVSAAKDYKLAWSINQVLKVNMIRQNPCQLITANEQIYLLQHFIYSTSNGFLRLLTNKCEKPKGESFIFLFPEVRQFDYFLQIDERGGSFNINAIVSALKSLDIIQYLLKIEPDKLKNKDILLT
jgi:hypothetical protein